MCHLMKLIVMKVRGCFGSSQIDIFRKVIIKQYQKFSDGDFTTVLSVLKEKTYRTSTVKDYN